MAHPSRILERLVAREVAGEVRERRPRQAQRRLERVAPGSTSFEPGTESHLRALGCSVAAGATAGTFYHFVSFPFDRALELAEPHTGPSRVARAAAHHGPAALYRGALRTAAPGVPNLY